MATPPTGVASDETVSVWFCEAVTLAGPKIATELDAVTSVRLECLLTENFAPDGSATVAETRRMCSKQVTQRGGTVTKTIGDLTYAYDPQAALTAAINLAYAALTEGAQGFLVVRWGIHVDVALAAAQKVDVYPVEITHRQKMAPEQNSELKCKSGVVVIGEVVEDVALAA